MISTTGACLLASVVSHIIPFYPIPSYPTLWGRLVQVIVVQQEMSCIHRGSERNSIALEAASLRLQKGLETEARLGEKEDRAIN